MAPHLQSVSRWGHNTLAGTEGRGRPQPPGLQQQPGTAWQRLLRWLRAPAPAQAAAAPSGLDVVRGEFLDALFDVTGVEVVPLRARLCQTRSLHGLWHLRAEVYRAVGVAHSQTEAERRMASLNRHFPARAPRSNGVPL